MSVEYYNCAGCGEIHSECEPGHICANCEQTVFNCCYEKQVKKYGVVEDAESTKYGRDALKGCDSCQKETVTITREEYEELQRDSEKLARLIAAGVDNWEGYSEA